MAENEEFDNISLTDLLGDEGGGDDDFDPLADPSEQSDDPPDSGGGGLDDAEVAALGAVADPSTLEGEEALLSEIDEETEKPGAAEAFLSLDELRSLQSLVYVAPQWLQIAGYSAIAVIIFSVTVLLRHWLLTT